MTTFTTKEICRDQRQQLMTFCKSENFKDALTLIDNLRAMDLDKNEPEYAHTMQILDKAEIMIKERI